MRELKLGDLGIKFIDGDRGKNYPKQDDLLPNGYCLFLSAKNITNDGFKLDELVFITKEKDNILRKGKLNFNDIIITTRGTIGNVCIYNQKIPFENVRINSGMLIVRSESNDIDTNYLFQYLKSDIFRERTKTFSFGAAVPQLPISTLINIKINLPPLPTQQRIAEILSGYDDLIENNLKRIKILEEMAQQTYEEWFVRMRFPGHESAVINPETGLPEGWEKVKLGELCDLQQGFALNKKSNHYISDFKTEYPLLKISDLINNTETLFVKESIPHQFKIDFEDIIYSRTGQVGLSFIGIKGIIYNNCFKVKPFNEEIKYYLLQFLRQRITIDIAKSLATGAAQPDLNHSAFKSIEIVKGDLSLSNKYSDYYKKIIRIIQNLQNQNQRLREARDILLPRLMMGIVKV